MKRILSPVAVIAALNLLLAFPTFGAEAPDSLSVENAFGAKSEMTFRLKIKEILESGFVKGLMEKHPEIAEGIEQAKSEDELKEFTELTGFGPDDIVEIAFSATGVDAIMEAQARGEEPKIGEDLGFVIAVRVAKGSDPKKLLGLVFDKTEEEEGPMRGSNLRNR